MKHAEPENPPSSVAANSDHQGTILSIQMLRFFAALSVVVFHAHNALVAQIPGHQPDNVDHAFKVGASGVHIFFVISGFVMFYTTWRSRLTPGGFLTRRLMRIYPIYWVVAATYFLVHIPLATPYDLNATQIVGTALLLPGYSSLIIGPGWTLSFEMYFYLCFAIALIAGLRRGLLILSAFYLGSVALGYLLAPPSASGHVITDSLLLEFIAGAWLGYAFAHGIRIRPATGSVLIILALALFASGFWFDYERLPSVIAWGIPSLFLVGGALALEPKLTSGFARQIAKLGDSSYLLYLSHILVLDLLIATPFALLSRNEDAALFLALPLAAVCTIVAAVGYEIVELPLLKLMKRYFLRSSKRMVQPSTVVP